MSDNNMQGKKRKAYIKSINAYQKRAMTAFSFCFHKEYDKPILDKLNEVENKADYIRQLILNDIHKGE